jgi:CMP-N-acetylneuraminic acid synthetase
MICIIPARGGSKRIPRKNLQVVGGVTLIERAIRLALSHGNFARLIVSSEDPEILEVAGEFATERPAELARDDVPTIDVVQYLMGSIAERELPYPQDICVLQCTTPELQAGDLTRVHAAYHELRGSRTVVSVSGGKRNGIYMFPEWAEACWSRYSLEVPTIGDYIDINYQSDLEEVRRRFGENP